MVRILVIDDDPLIRDMLSQVLEEAGYGVVPAPDGDVGMKLFREDPTDLIITDIVMPEKDGWETVVALKKEFPDVKIIAVSGGAKIGPFTYLMTAKRLGADLIFAKPLKKHELLMGIQELLAK